MVTLTVSGTVLYERKKKQEREAQEAKELQQAIQATHAVMLKMREEEAVRAMAKHKAAIDEISTSWKESLESSRKYYEELDARAEAEMRLRRSELELEKQRRLNGASQ